MLSLSCTRVPQQGFVLFYQYQSIVARISCRSSSYQSTVYLHRSCSNLAICPLTSSTNSYLLRCPVATGYLWQEVLLWFRTFNILDSDIRSVRSAINPSLSFGRCTHLPRSIFLVSLQLSFVSEIMEMCRLPWLGCHIFVCGNGLVVWPYLLIL
jgi:hypothetical protein